MNIHLFAPFGSLTPPWIRDATGTALRAKIWKAGRLGNDRPSLWARLGCGVIEALGCVGRGFDERLGRPPTGYRVSVPANL